ncbi:polysaccharide biosynthesis/export family protein [Acidipila sp. EB88]|uniref:polysaccharide biosynthesis/export family protein n=1 Tax=Acidipila sp. EB88 TaxID=2305226 RepID=UPI0013157829|nr:polysaccharide biosynthesis/export family protein [Acidipila sp. EB88]
MPPESVVLGAGDLVSVHVFREDALDSKIRVKDAGTLTLPLIGTVTVAGLSAADAAATIAKRFEAQGFLNAPQVTVLVEESAAREVEVLGDVAKPGPVTLNGRRPLLDVLAEAGGLLKTADRHVTIRRVSGSIDTVFIPNTLISAPPMVDALVAPGDAVLVPRAGIVYVLGDVGRPGGYLMEDDAHLSLLQALSLAAGASKTASEGGAHLIRRVHGETLEVPLHLKDVERGKLPDPALENNDIVYIPFSFSKNLALGSASVAASASSAIIYAAY